MMADVEAAVLDQIAKLRLDSTLINEFPSTDNSDERKALEKRVVVLDKKLEKLVGLYLDDMLPLNSLNTKKQAFNEEKETIEAKLVALDKNKKELSAAEAAGILAKTPANIRTLSYDDQKVLVKKLVSKITLTADTVRVYWRFA